SSPPYMQIHATCARSDKTTAVLNVRTMSTNHPSSPRELTVSKKCMASSNVVR
ncbi:hypothetical protein CEXT_486891, partial [Caerostris extrusa]